MPFRYLASATLEEGEKEESPGLILGLSLFESIFYEPNSLFPIIYIGIPKEVHG